MLVFVGGAVGESLLGVLGLGAAAVDTWTVARWPAALAVAMLGFAYIYYVTPDVHHRSFRWITPGAIVGVLLWLIASIGFSAYVTRLADVGALYGQTLDRPAKQR